MRHKVVFSNRRHGTTYEEYELHANAGPVFTNERFWKDVKNLAANSKQQRVKSWATRGPCNQLPLCLRIEVFRIAIDRLTGEKERCAYLGSVKV
jgi:hypothetical protein